MSFLLLRAGLKNETLSFKGIIAGLPWACGIIQARIIRLFILFRVSVVNSK